jgi:hypothetical protein
MWVTKTESRTARDLLVRERLLVARPAAQRMLRPQQEALAPLLDLGDGQAMLAGRLGG